MRNRVRNKPLFAAEGFIQRRSARQNSARIMKMGRRNRQESSEGHEKALPFSERDRTDKHSATESESGSSEKSSEISNRRREVSDVAVRQNRVERSSWQTPRHLLSFRFKKTTCEDQPARKSLRNSLQRKNVCAATVPAPCPAGLTLRCLGRASHKS
jgi:hypothetical protein